MIVRLSMMIMEGYERGASMRAKTAVWAGGGANGGGKNVYHEMMWPGGVGGPRGGVSVNGMERRAVAATVV